ncbi:MAG: hypothetical protein LC135_03200 [Phycisphaerae bacterium]|nr:hypothetical protein [Phycisphaerae bacterium]MCZ2398862.1 hypothetical protein [Phycisphaerae bacterium]
MATQPNGDTDMTNAKTNDGIDANEVLDTLVIKKVQRRTSAGGAWVVGTIAGHRFDALVFPEPATNREWEVGGDSRISKLWVQRISDKATVYNWDRGADVEPATELAGVIVDLLAAGLAEHIWNA